MLMVAKSLAGKALNKSNNLKKLTIIKKKNKKDTNVGQPEWQNKLTTTVLQQTSHLIVPNIVYYRDV